MAGVCASNRRRVAILLIGLGAGLVLLGSICVLTYQPIETIHSPVPRSPAPPRAKVVAMRHMLFWSFVFLLIFVVSTLAFLRWSRRFRKWMFRKPHAPTPSEDVWAMHKLPEGALEDWNDPEPGEPDRPRPPE